MSNPEEPSSDTIDLDIVQPVAVPHEAKIEDVTDRNAEVVSLPQRQQQEKVDEAPAVDVKQTVPDQEPQINVGPEVKTEAPSLLPETMSKFTVF